MAIASRTGKLFAVAFAILLADLLSKWATSAWLPPMNASPSYYPYGGIGVFRNLGGIEFSLVYTTNKGAAWGWLSNFQLPLLCLRIAVVFGLLLFLCKFNKHPALDYPLVAILAGATGNVIDFFLYGHVVDMIHFNLWGYSFPVFNLADTAISLGVGWLLVTSLFESKYKSPKKSRKTRHGRRKRG